MLSRGIYINTKSTIMKKTRQKLRKGKWGKGKKKRRKRFLRGGGGNTVCGASRPHLGSPGEGSHWRYWCGP